MKNKNNPLNESNESMINHSIEEIQKDPIDQFGKSEKMMQELYENAIKWREALYFHEYFREINQDTHTAETAEALMYFIKNPSALDFIQNSSIMSLDENTEEKAKQAKQRLALLGIKEGIAGYDEVATKKIKMIWHMTQIQINKIKDLKKKNSKKDLSDEHVRVKILNTMEEKRKKIIDKTMEEKRKKIIDKVTAEYDNKISHDVKEDEQMSDYGLFFHLLISLECSLLTDVPESKIQTLNETIFNETIFTENPNAAELKSENQLFRLEILQFFTYFNMKSNKKSTDYINKRLELFKNFLSYPNEEYTLIMIDRLLRGDNDDTKLPEEIDQLRKATKANDADYHLTLKIFSLALIKNSSWLTSWLNDNNKYNNFIQSILKGQKQETVKNSIEILKENIDEGRGLKENLDTILTACNSIKNTEQNENSIENEIIDNVIDDVKQESATIKETIYDVQRNVSNTINQVENAIVSGLESVNTVVQANNQNNNSTNNGTNQNNNSANDGNLVIQNNQNIEEKGMENTSLIIGGAVVIVPILIFVVYYSSSSTQESKDYNNVLELSPISDETNH